MLSSGRIGASFVSVFHNSLYRKLWLRVHLIIDHISGMTDEFALQTYQMLEGINLLRQ